MPSPPGISPYQKDKARHETHLLAVAQSTWDAAGKVLLGVFDEHFGDATPAGQQAYQARMAELHRTIIKGAQQGPLVAEQLYVKLREWLDERLKEKVTKPLIELRDSGDAEKLPSKAVQLAKSFLEFKNDIRFALCGHLAKSVDWNLAGSAKRC